MNKNQKDFITKCISRHGHEALWNPGKSLSLTINSMKGIIPVTKGASKFFTNPVKVEIFPFDRVVHFYDVNGFKKIEYNKGAVKLINNDEKQFRHHREYFSRFNKMKSWSIQDTFYFFGYALVTYYSIPSLLLDLEIFDDYMHGSVRGFKVKFPASFDTHCELQTFFFDETGLLMRHDYTADIVSKFANGSHFTKNYIEKDGIMVAQERVVTVRVGKGLVTSIPVLKASIS